MPINRYRDFVLDATSYETDGQSVERFSVKVLDSLGGESTGVTKSKILPDLRKELRWLEDRKLDVDGLISLGEKLSDLLLPDEVRELLFISLGKLEEKEGLRLRLMLAPELASFAWEYMYLPLTGGRGGATDFLVLDKRVSIVRHEPVRISSDFEDTPKKRRLLVALASPQGQEPLDLARERRNLTEALNDVPGIELDFVENATVEALTDKLATGTDIFHFAGHGTFNRTGMGEIPRTERGEGAILLVGKDGGAEEMSAEVLARYLGGPGPKLVVLGACRTAQRGEGEGSDWGSGAAALMKVGIPAAVAMQYGIWDDAAIAFNRSFYRALAASSPLDYAVTAGRLAALTKCYPVRNRAESGKFYRDWGVPVLYLRARKEFVLPAIADAAERKKQVRKVERETRVTGGIRKWIYAAVAAAGTAAVVGGLFLSRVLSCGIEVPNVYGEHVKNAKKELNEAGFTVEADWEDHRLVEKDCVIETDPCFGKRLREGSAVNIVVSNGPPVERVPDVEGFTKSAARRELTKSPYKFRIAGEKEEDSEKTKIGLATRTDPEAGSYEVVGSDVWLYISNGKAGEFVEVLAPYTGESGRAFSDRLKEEGFNVRRVEREPSNDVEKGRVIRTVPPGGTELGKGSDITLVLSAGPETELVFEATSLKVSKPPSVKGQKYEEAVKRLKSLAFKTAVKRIPRDDVRPGVVIAQSQPRKNTITLDVSAGPERCPVCDERVGLDEPVCPSCEKPLDWWRP